MHVMGYYPAWERNDILMHSSTRMELEDTVLSEMCHKRTKTDSTSMRYLEWTHIDRKWCGGFQGPGGGGHREVLTSGYRISAWEKVHKVQERRGKGCRTRWTCVMLLNCALKNGKTVSFYVVCILSQEKYQKKKEKEKRLPLLLALLRVPILYLLSIALSALSFIISFPEASLERN